MYVGQSTLSINERWLTHLSDKNSANFPLYSAMRKYGISNFSIEEIFHAENQQQLNFLEILLIAALKSQDEKFGYNIQDGGARGKHVQATKDKISASKKGCIGPRKGIPRTEEVKHKISIANKGRVKSSEERAAIAIRMKDVKITWGHKISASLRAKGIKPPNYDKPKSTEVKKKMSEGCLRRSTPAYRLTLSRSNTFRNLLREGFYGS